MQRGEATFFELAGCYRRYHTPLCRTVFLGRAPQEMRDASKALSEGLEAGLEAARAGNRACDIANALGAVLERAGIERGARCGYPVGLSYPPDWGERTISLRDSDETVLEPGMTFHFMPGLWMEGWGLENHRKHIDPRQRTGGDLLSPAPAAFREDLSDDQCHGTRRGQCDLALCAGAVRGLLGGRLWLCQAGPEPYRADHHAGAAVRSGDGHPGRDAECDAGAVAARRGPLGRSGAERAADPERLFRAGATWRSSRG